MKKGFTLIEMIAVIAIMGLITALILPNIVNQVSSKSNDISKASKDLIYTATELYIDDNSNQFSKGNNIYCIKLQTLVDNGYLDKPLKDVSNNKNIPLDNLVKVSFNEYNEAVYELTDKDNCN